MLSQCLDFGQFFCCSWPTAVLSYSRHASTKKSFFGRKSSCFFDDIVEKSTKSCSFFDGLRCMLWSDTVFREVRTGLKTAFGQTTPLLMMRRLFLRWQMHTTLAAAYKILRTSDGTIAHRSLGLTYLLARSESMIESQNAGFDLNWKRPAKNWRVTAVRAGVFQLKVSSTQ